MAAQRAFHNYRNGDPDLEDLSGNSVFYFQPYASFARGGEVEPTGRYIPPGSCCM